MFPFDGTAVMRDATRRGSPRRASARRSRGLAVHAERLESLGGASSRWSATSSTQLGAIAPAREACAERIEVLVDQAVCGHGFLLRTESTASTNSRQPWRCSTSFAEPARGQPVELAAPAGCLGPLVIEQPRALEPVQHGVHRALRQIEGAVAAIAQPFDHPVAVDRTLGHQGQHEQVEVTFECFSCSYLAMLGLVSLGVNAASRRFVDLVDSPQQTRVTTAHLLWSNA